ncbi:MAG: GNAT family N-acetyltransferase [Sporichthyaceae bacterium]
MTTVRDALPSDIDNLYDVCLRTGDEGRDASGWMSRPRLLGDIFVGPYLRFAPELALTADDGVRAAGYALAVLDTERFEATLEDEWWPALCDTYPIPGPGPLAAEDGLLALVHDSALRRRPVLPGFPSHLHIDLLEHLRGEGLGERMMQELFVRLRSAGSPGVHLGVAAANTGAQRFYARLGFVELQRGDDEIYLGLSWR